MPVNIPPLHPALKVLLAANALEKAAARTFKPHGLTPAQFNVLNLLALNPDGVMASELAKALVVDPSNVTGLLKRMKEDSFVLDVASPQDRRQHVVCLSAKGKRVWTAAVADYRKGLAELETAFAQRDRAAAERFLDQIIAFAPTLA